MRNCELKITRREHDESGTEFRAKITNIQGIYDAEIGGHFQHWQDDSGASTWDPNQWARVNTQEYTIEDVYALLGNGDPDVGVEALDALLVPVMEHDHGLWLLDNENVRQESLDQQCQDEAFYQRQQGF